MATVGAYRKRGWHGLHVHCRPCNTIHVLIWAYLRQPDEMPITAITTRLRCRKCGDRPAPEDIKPYYLDTATADGSSKPVNPSPTRVP